MATLFDMLFGGGTGAVTQPMPYASPAPSQPSYADMIGRFGNPNGLEGTGPLEWRGETANTVPVMTMPSMPGGARSTPTEWPVPISRFEGFPHNYYPGMGTARQAPDFATLNRLTAEMTGGGRPPATAVSAIEQAAPNRFASYRATPHMALQRRSDPAPVHNLDPMQDSSAQQIANDLGMPVRTSRGSVVSPSGAAGGRQSVAGRIAPSGRGFSLFDAVTGGAKPSLLQDIMTGIGSMQMPKMGGGPTPGSPAAKWLQEGGGYYKSPGTGASGSLSS